MDSLADARPPPKVVLLIVDDRARLAVVALVLEFAGFTVLPATTAADGRDRAQGVRLHAIVTDVAEPSPSDWDDVRRWHASLATQEALLVLVVDRVDVVPRPLIRLCAAVMTRPVEPAALVQVLREISP
jgi:DNA-binding response OmpR family regulator